MSVANSNQTISFAQDAQLINDLLAVLTREQGHLVKLEVDAVEAILEEKSVLLQRLNLTSRSRYEALAAKGFDANEAGMEAWIQKQAKKDISAAWANFQKALNQAKELNRLNGLLISKHFNRNQELLNHLQGKSSTDSVYGRDGQANSKAPARSGLIV